MNKYILVIFYIHTCIYGGGVQKSIFRFFSKTCRFADLRILRIFQNFQNLAQLCILANIIFKRAFYIKIKFGRISRFRRIDFLVSSYRSPAIFEDNNKLFLLLSKSAITLINFFACFRKICDFGAFAHLFNNHGYTVESA